MAENYYVRFKQGENWVNALREGQKYITKEVAEEIMNKLEEKQVSACLFVRTEDGKSELVRKTKLGVEM